MRPLCTLVLACSLWLLPSSLGGGGAADAAQLARPCAKPSTSADCPDANMFPAAWWSMARVPSRASPDEAPEPATTGEPGATAPAGNADQGFQGGVAGQEAVKPGEHSCPPGYRVLAVPTQSGYCELAKTPVAADPACQHGMVGTPPVCPLPPEFRTVGRQLRPLHREVQ
jgi:hypothetical protein